jgi:hypothetical protein
MRSLLLAARRARTVGLLALGAFAVHQGSYLLTAGSAGIGGGDQHGYLELLAPVLAIAAAAAVAVSLLATALGRRAPASLRPEGTTERAALYALGLLATYLCQELAEGLLAGGHASLVAGVLGGPGWAAAPLAIAIGALAAFAQGWLDRAELRIVAALTPPPRRAPRSLGAARVARGRVLTSLPLAFGLSRRPPPFALAG